MRSNHPDLLNSYNRLFHISEQPGITLFEPRPSPSFLPGITSDAVFAISGKRLHNYLLPRDCPRVTYYLSAETTPGDEAKFLSNSSVDFVVVVESAWYCRIRDTILYVYEFPPDNFNLIDETAGYYVSYHPVTPSSVHMVKDPVTTMLQRNVELRLLPSLTHIANEVRSSSLNFSLIRMRNAKL